MVPLVMHRLTAIVIVVARKFFFQFDFNIYLLNLMLFCWNYYSSDVVLADNVFSDVYGVSEGLSGRLIKIRHCRILDLLSSTDFT